MQSVQQNRFIFYTHVVMMTLLIILSTSWYETATLLNLLGAAILLNINVFYKLTSKFEGQKKQQRKTRFYYVKAIDISFYNREHLERSITD